MSVSEWIDRQQMTGWTTFTFEEVIKALPSLSRQNISNSLWRLSTAHIIAPVQRGFYVIIPPTSRISGITDPYYYIDSLMNKIGRDYYVCLRSAAALHGASHQAVLQRQVMLPVPHISFSSIRNHQLAWFYRSHIPTTFLDEHKTESGYIKVSSPELTALDLVQYCAKSGGLSSVATMLAEIGERLDFSKNDGRVLTTASSATIQRLGYLLENILGFHDVADMLSEFWHLYFKRPNYALMSPKSGQKAFLRNEHWKVDVNATIEIDDL